jgi:hypothetical protein
MSSISITIHVKHIISNSILYKDISKRVFSGVDSCVQREWKLEEFPDTEIIDLATNAWEIVAEALFETARFLGAKLIQPKLDKISKDDYQIEAYHPQWVKEQYDSLEKRVHTI